MNKEQVTKYILQQFCEWYYEVNPENRINDKNDLSVLKVLKLIFFLATIKKNEQTLLGNPYDNFVAMPLGPVEVDVYNYFLNHTDIINYSNINSEFLSDVILESNDKIIVDNLLNDLKEKNYDLINQDAFYLVDLSHEWTCWLKTYNEAKEEGLKAKKMTINDIKDSTRRFYTY